MNPNLELIVLPAGGPPQKCLPSGTTPPQEPALQAAGGSEGAGKAPCQALAPRQDPVAASGGASCPPNDAAITDNYARELKSEGRVDVLSEELAVALWNKACEKGGPFPAPVRRFARWAIVAADNLRSRAKAEAEKSASAPAAGGQS